MAYTSLTFSFGSLLTSTKMTQLFDNFAAFAAKASGSPVLDTDYVTQDMIAAAQVGQSELKSATASQSVVVPAASGSATISQLGYNQITLTGGSYTMGWFVGANNAYYKLESLVGHHNGLYTAKVGLRNALLTGDVPQYMYSRYIQASPPYDLGNGEIPIFIYALIAKTGNAGGFPAGKLLATSCAVDPAWAYNGPDHINPNNLIKMPNKEVVEMVRFMPHPKEAAMADAGKMQENIAAILDPTHVPEVVDMARKLRNMPNEPHPFLGDVNLEHGEVVLLDPLSPLAMAAFELVGEEDHGTIKEMLEHPSLVIGSDQISGLAVPPNVKGVRVTL